MNSLVENIKKQNELEDKIAKLQDKSDELGKVIMKQFEEMSHEERVEHYDSLPCCSTKYNIFSKFFYPLIKERKEGKAK